MEGRRGRKKKSANYWLVGIIVFLALIIVGIFSYVSLKEIHQKKEVKNEINSLKKQAEKIKEENMQVKEKLSYLSSEEYQKMTAKEKLNLQEPDEKVVVLSQNPIKIKKKIVLGEQTANEYNSSMKTVPNFQKWWNYFFSK